MIQALIIDDEKPASELLSTLIREFIPDVKILGEAHSVKAGIQMINALQPELVFLDIQMPQGGGFALLRSFDKLPFSVIFTTAYDQYAIKAIQYSALDYILKPITLKRLQDSVSRFRKKKEQEDQQEAHIYLLPDNLIDLHQQTTKIVVPIPKGMRIISISEIAYLKASGVYSEMMLEDGTIQMVSKGLKHFEQLLGPYGLVRVHDSYIVNFQHIDRYMRGRGGEVIMKDGTSIEVSRGRKENFIKLLKRGQK